MALKKASEFQAHLELPGLFEVFIIPTPEGTRFQFYAYPETEENFPEYLAQRFSHLGEPADLVYREDFRCYDVFFRGLRFNNPEDALQAIVRP